MILSHAHRREMSYSEMATWRTCRQRWYWSYVRNLESVSTSRPLQLGKLGHIGVAAYYRNHDVDAGVDAIVEAVELDCHNRFAEEIEDIVAVGEQAKELLRRYAANYKQEFRIVATEVPFDISIQRTKHRLVGYIDALVEDHDGCLWIMEHKFPTQQFRDEDDIDLATQLGVYQHAVAKMGHNVVGVIYNQVLAKLPAIPKINQNGTVSRSELYCDWSTYASFVRSLGQDPESYREDMEPKLQHKEFFKRYYVHRLPAQTRMFAEDIEAVAYSLATKRKHIYMSDNAIHCRGCQYREICVERNRGRDPEQIIDAVYRHKPNRTLPGQEPVDAMAEGV